MQFPQKNLEIASKFANKLSNRRIYSYTPQFVIQKAMNSLIATIVMNSKFLVFLLLCLVNTFVLSTGPGLPGSAIFVLFIKHLFAYSCRATSGEVALRKYRRPFWAAVSFS